MLCNELWIKEIPTLVAKFNSNSDISCVKVVCGSGRLAPLFNAEGLSYTGIDIQDPECLGFQTSETSSFIRSGYLESSKIIADHDIFVSQSALENFDFDKRFFTKIAEDRLSSPKTQFYDLHLVPARLSLFNYLGHGVRQYSIEDVVNLYMVSYPPKDYGISINFTKLGGIGLFLSHFVFITLGNIFRLRELRHSKPAAYAYANLIGAKLDAYLGRIPPCVFFGV